MMNFGSELRQHRLSQGMGLDALSTSTKISLRYLVALESDRFTELPGGVFNRGIVRSYAKALGLDEKRQVEQYLQASGETLAPAVTDMGWTKFAQNVSASRGGTRRRSAWVGVVGMFAGLAGLATVVWVAVAHHF